jgi:CDP-paratose 2-epimerase
MLAALAEFEVLLSVWHTPPSLAEGGTCSSPPRRLRDYADFIDTLITNHGRQFAALELWNEPNNRYKWDFPRFDPGWRKFAEMVGSAAYWARQRNVTTVLGGMIPIDPHWLRLMRDHGVLEYCDVIAIHGFPGMWWNDAPNWDWYQHWQGWPEKIQTINALAPSRPIWITETGLATWHREGNAPGRFHDQVTRLHEAIAAPVPRLYWYTLIDLDPAREAIEGFHVDENEYHLGLVTHDGEPKPAFHALAEMLRTAAADPSLPASGPRR